MGTGHDPLSITKTLSGTTADTITLDQPWPYVQVTNQDSTHIIWVSVSSTNTPTTAVAAAAGCIPVLPMSTQIIQAVPIQSGTGVGTIVVSVVGDGGTYTVTGVNSRNAMTGAGVLASLGVITRRKLANQGIVDTTQTDITDMSFPVGIGKSYIGKCVFFYDTTTSNDARFYIVASSGLTVVVMGGVGLSTSATTTTGNISSATTDGVGGLSFGGSRAAGAAAVKVMCVLHFTVTNTDPSAVVGTVKIQGRKVAATDATSPADDFTVYANSYLQATEVA